MERKVCFIYVETNGLHETYMPVTKKHLFEYARIVALNYEIGYRKDGEYIQEKKVRKIMKPRCMVIHKESIDIHGIKQSKAMRRGEDPAMVMKEFINDIKNVSVIISHNIDFHMKAIIAEAMRYNMYINVDNYLIIDTNKFMYESMKLKDLSSKVLNNSYENKEPKFNLQIIKKVFYKQYDEHIKS